MTLEEARKIFKDWQDYQEIADKMGCIFSVVPESFLPYPINTLEEALNIVAKSCFDSGDKKTANNIQETMGAYLTGYYLKTSNGKVEACDQISEDEVLEKMKNKLDMILKNPELKKIIIKKLQDCCNSWLKFKIQNNK